MVLLRLRFSLLLASFSGIAFGQNLGIDLENLDVASNDELTFSRLRDYAENLVGQSGWPIVFHDFILITSSLGGVDLVFRTDIDRSRATEPTPQEQSFARMSYAEKMEHWKATFCTPELQSIVEELGLFGSLVIDDTTNQTLSVGAYTCLEEEN